VVRAAYAERAVGADEAGLGGGALPAVTAAVDVGLVAVLDVIHTGGRREVSAGVDTRAVARIGGIAGGIGGSIASAVGRSAVRRV
jgi:hypothetical protein